MKPNVGFKSCTDKASNKYYTASCDVQRGVVVRRIRSCRWERHIYRKQELTHTRAHTHRDSFHARPCKSGTWTEPPSPSAVRCDPSGSLLTGVGWDSLRLGSGDWANKPTGTYSGVEGCVTQTGVGVRDDGKGRSDWKKANNQITKQNKDNKDMSHAEAWPKVWLKIENEKS